MAMQSGTEIRGLRQLRLLPEEQAKGFTQEASDRLLDTLVDLNPDIPVPEECLTQEINRLLMIAGQQQKYRMFGIAIEETAQEDLSMFNQEQLRVLARRQVIEDELIRRIIQNEHLTVQESELHRQIKKIEDEQHLPEKSVREILGEDCEMLRTDILYRQAQEFLYEMALHNESADETKRL